MASVPQNAPIWDYNPCQVSYNSKNHCTSPFQGCVRNMKVLYLENPPYIFKSKNGDVEGYWKYMVQTFLENVCCKTVDMLEFITSDNYTNQEDLIKFCNDYPKRCDISVGALLDSSNSTEIADNSASVLMSTYGAVFITLQGEVWRTSLLAVADGIVMLWPLLFISMVLAVVSGLILWFFESNTNQEHFPSDFLNGIYQGFWWGVVSMTTVGYGDKVPITVPGRIFSIIWLIIGISLISVITSILSNSMTKGLEQPAVVISGKNVAYLALDELAENTINDKSGTPKVANDIEELEYKVATGEVDGFVMDEKMLLYHYKNRLKDLNVKWILQTSYKYNDVFGLIFYNETTASAWQNCYNAYIKKNEEKKETMLASFISKVEVDSGILEKDPLKVFLIDPSSDEFIGFVIFSFVFFAFLIMVQVALNCFKQHFHMSHSKNNPGYTAKVVEPPPEEVILSNIVEETLKQTEWKIKELEKQMKNDILNMSRAIRSQIASTRLKSALT